MRVLIVYPKFYVYGGGEMLVVRLCNYLSENGIENSILTTAMISDVEKDLSDTNVIIAPNHNGTAFGEIKALCRGVRKCAHEYDVINPHNYPAELTSLFTRTPSVWMCNEPELHLTLCYGIINWKYRCFLKALYVLQKYIVRREIMVAVVSDAFNAARFNTIYGVAPQIINYGIDADYYSEGDRDSSRMDLGLTDEFVMLHVGMMTPLKNQLKSLNVLNMLKFRIDRLKLVLAGSWQDEYKKLLDSFIEENGLTERVVFTGHVTREILRNWYRASDVLIHPVKEQGGWLSPFEAIAAGLPIIVSREMTASDIIAREGLGIISDDYAEAVVKIAVERGKCVNGAGKAARWVRSNLSWNSFGEKMIAIFERINEENATIRD